MKQNLTLTIFAVLAVIQLAVPATMIIGRETTLQEGERYLFRTAPVDPYDPFRGRYVAIRLQPQTAPPVKGVTLGRDQTAYAVLTKDDEGFAAIERLSLSPPDTGDYIRVRASSWANNTEPRVDWPIDRYYMDENLAPEAERAYRRARWDDGAEAYVALRVRRGNAVIEELYIEDKPVAEYVRQQQSEE